MSEVSQGRLPEDAEEARKKDLSREADREQPGGQERPMSKEEVLDEALDETFPASDPVQPSRIDGPNN